MTPRPDPLSAFRLIVTDMDGTLLDGQRRLPPHFPALVRALAARGIGWAIASGRQLANLHAQFAALGLTPDLIAENGALARLGGEREPFFRDLTPAAFFAQVIAEARTIPGATPVLCGEDCAWVDDRCPENFEAVSHYFARTRHLPLDPLPAVDLCKVAIYHRDAARALWPRLSPLARPELRVIHSSPCWLDVQHARINKGRALSALLARRALPPQAAIVFGDYLNDLEMMTLGTHAVAMANAHPDLLALCPHRAPANTQYGVVKYLLARRFTARA